ncbi:MAG: hypothetical protein V4651_08845 [Bacteroidota bacterium]
MKMQWIILILIGFLVTSCIVQSPKYTSLEQVMKLKVGMTKGEVEKELGIQPYNVKRVNDSMNVFIYVYRVVDRRTLSLYTTPVNGRKALGKHMQLAVAYNKNDVLVNIESCIECSNDLVSMSKLDFQKITMFITVTLPVVLLYVGLK